MSYTDVMDKILDSFDVTAGGGSSSAIAGAMAAGLIGMVARLSMKKDYGLPKKKYLEIADELDKLREELLEGSEEDTKAYLLIKEAYRLPKSTENEKKERDEAIEKAGIVAATVPMDNAYKCKRVYELGLMMEGKYNTNTSPDFIIGMNLAKVGIQGCVLNIEVNLPLIKDKKVKNQFKDHMKKLKQIFNKEVTN